MLNEVTHIQNITKPRRTLRKENNPLWHSTCSSSPHLGLSCLEVSRLSDPPPFKSRIRSVGDPNTLKPTVIVEDPMGRLQPCTTSLVCSLLLRHNLAAVFLAGLRGTQTVRPDKSQSNLRGTSQSSQLPRSVSWRYQPRQDQTWWSTWCLDVQPRFF